MLFYPVVAVSISLPICLGASPFVEYSSVTSTRGDHFPDFSFCGYQASIHDLPSIDSNVTEIISPTSGDQTARIQSALNQISERGGGVLLLSKGHYEIYSSLILPNATVLRGSGQEKTTLLFRNASSDAITLGLVSEDPQFLPVTNITDEYVPIGASTFNVSNTTELSVGQQIMIQRSVTEEWVRTNGMSDLTRNNQSQTWIPVGRMARQPRKIVSIENQTIKVDVPLTDGLDARYMQAMIASYKYPEHASSEVGLESLAIVLNPSCSGKVLTDTTCTGGAVAISPWVRDSWVRDLRLSGFNFFVLAKPWAFRITIESVKMYRDHDSDISAGLPADITLQGTQVLVYQCSSHGSGQTFPIVTQSLTAGPNAVVEHYSQQRNNIISPHQRWAHGLLVENSRTSLVLGNRGYYGTGQGWSINAGVGWNIGSPNVDVSSPTLGMNWCVGCGTKKMVEGNGTFLDSGNTVEPKSLYWTQLHARGIQRSEAYRTFPSLSTWVMLTLLSYHIQLYNS